jgi:hypothetical protein
MRRYAADGLVVALLCLLLAYPVRAAWPLTGSQVITLEHGPTGCGSARRGCWSYRLLGMSG